MDVLPYSIPACAPAYGPLPYRYRGCPQLLVPFRAAPGIVRRLVPEPLEPNPDDVMFLMIGEMRSDEFGTNREAFLAVPARLGGMRGNYAVALYLDHDAAIASGREVWGWPKKAAHLRIDRDGETTTATVTRGAELIRARHTGADPVAAGDLGLEPTWFNLKLIPSVIGGAPPDVMQITSTTLEDVTVTDARAGEATLAFGGPASDPLGDLVEVREVLAGVSFVLSCDLTLGQVVHDYLAAGPAPRVATPATI